MNSAIYAQIVASQQKIYQVGSMRNIRFVLIIRKMGPGQAMANDIPNCQECQFYLRLKLITVNLREF